MTSSHAAPTRALKSIKEKRGSSILRLRWERERPARLTVEANHVWSALPFVMSTALIVMSAWTRLALTQNSSVTLGSFGDTYLKQGAPNANQGSEVLLRLQQGGSNRVLVKFDQQALEQAVGSSGVRSARLRLYIAANANNWGSDGREVNAHQMMQSWTEAGATWNCPTDANTANTIPDCGAGWPMSGSTPPFLIAPSDVILHQNNQTGWVEWDVSSDVRGFLSHTVTNHGWVLRKDDESATGQVDYGSRESVNSPQLVVELGEPVPTSGSALTASADADVRAGSPNQNQGNRMRLQVQSSGTNRVLVQFDRQAMLQRVADGNIQTAKLRLYVVSNSNNWGSSGRAVNVHRMTQAWTEQGVTWNCANDLNPFNSQSD